MDATVGDGLGGVLAVELDAGESLLAASGSLVDHTGGVRVERAREGVLRSVANAARERQVTPVRVVASDAATARFAPSFHGEVAACDLVDGDVSTAQGAFLAAGDDVAVGADSVGSAPARGAGVFLTTVSGEEAAYVAGRGHVERRRLDPGDGGHVVAASNLVAFDAALDVTVRRVSAMESAAAVCELAGDGRVWVATRDRA
jgi:uncharacterized protein (AIM24 family)